MTAPPIAERLRVMKPSATVAVAQRAAELRAQGVDVLSFSVGEPDFPPPDHVSEAAKQAIDAGRVHQYTAVRGVPELREAICQDSAHRRGVATDPSEVVVSVGAKHTLFNLAFALFEPGDEVIVPAPYWVSYPAQVRMAGATPTVVETRPENGFRLTPDQLRAALRPNTKALILCSPSNPTGSAYTGDQLRALADALASHSCWVIVDEIYGRLVYGGFAQQSLLQVAPSLRERIIVVDGVSKTFAMTGWRIGWMIGPAHVAAACDKLQGQSTTNPTAVAQYAALAALQGPQEPIEKMREQFEGRRDFFIAGLNKLPGVECRMPEGAFYAFCDVSALLGKEAGGFTLSTDLEVAQYLLEAARCAVVPGTAFGAPGFIRLSYATSNENLEEGLRRMGEALASVK